MARAVFTMLRLQAQHDHQHKVLRQRWKATLQKRLLTVSAHSSTHIMQKSSASYSFPVAATMFYTLKYLFACLHEGNLWDHVGTGFYNNHIYTDLCIKT